MKVSFSVECVNDCEGEDVLKVAVMQGCGNVECGGNDGEGVVLNGSFLEDGDSLLYGTYSITPLPR